MNKLYLETGKIIEGTPFGAKTDSSGELVFTTGMTGYLETLTDPSYYGQIVVFTFPLIGNYGVFKKDKKQIDETFESEKIWVKGVVLTENSINFSHHQGFQTLDSWLKENNIPGMMIDDTRMVTQTLRDKGSLQAAIASEKPKNMEDPLDQRHVPEVSPNKVTILEPEKTAKKTIAFIDCGAKNGIFRQFLKRGIRIIRCPFDQNPLDLNMKFDGVFFSNGPGDPQKVPETVNIMKKLLEKDIPIFGICLGNQILSLALGAKTQKMKYGHRGVNQPCREKDSGKCIITSQNHGFEVIATNLPKDFEVWFTNLNDGSVEGIRHIKKPIFSLQFHPEACGGPEDAEYLFDIFIQSL